jgi:hypothetical protein
MAHCTCPTDQLHDRTNKPSINRSKPSPNKPSCACPARLRGVPA